MTIRQILSELGVYVPPPRGRPTLYSSREEARRVQRQKCKVAQSARTVADKADKQAGAEPTKRKKGRPPIYATAEEAKAAQRAQNRACRERLNERIQMALRSLKPVLDSAAQPTRSNAQANIVHVL